MSDSSKFSLDGRALSPEGLDVPIHRPDGDPEFLGERRGADGLAIATQHLHEAQKAIRSRHARETATGWQRAPCGLVRETGRTLLTESGGGAA